MFDPLHLWGATNLSDMDSIAMPLKRVGYPVDGTYLANQLVLDGKDQSPWAEVGYGFDLRDARTVFEKYGFKVESLGPLPQKKAAEYLSRGAIVIYEGAPYAKAQFHVIGDQGSVINHSGYLTTQITDTSVTFLDPAANNGAGGSVTYTAGKFYSATNLLKILHEAIVVWPG